MSVEALKRLGGPGQCPVCKVWGRDKGRHSDGPLDYGPNDVVGADVRQWSYPADLMREEWKFYGCQACASDDYFKSKSARPAS